MWRGGGEGEGREGPSSDEGDDHQGHWLLQSAFLGAVCFFEIAASSAPDVRVPTTPSVSLPPGIQSPPASDPDSSLSGFRSIDFPLRLRVDDACACLREDDNAWIDGWRAHFVSLGKQTRYSRHPSLYRSGTSPRVLETVAPSLSWSCSWSFPGTLVLLVTQINAPLRTTSTDLGTSSACRNVQAF